MGLLAVRVHQSGTQVHRLHNYATVSDPVCGTEGERPTARYENGDHKGQNKGVAEGVFSMQSGWTWSQKG